MCQTGFIPNSLCKSIIILQILSWNVEAKWTNNHTLIKIINDMNTTWTAGENQMLIPDDFRLQKPKDTGAPTLQSKPVSTPETFDARTHWKHCGSVIGKIRHQGKCGSCWAVATASVLSDRTCIETNGSLRVHLSAEDIMTCCDLCVRIPSKYSCAGGYMDDALYFWMKEGIVTGGELNSELGCKPYSQESYQNKSDLPCTRRCTNRNHWKEYEEDKHKGKLIYRVRNDEEAIRAEIFNHGPVVTGFDVYLDFFQYRRGIYQNVAGKNISAHAVKIIGWGEESGKKYWLIANTWGVGWGMKGYMKFIRGENNCKIEEAVVAGRNSHSLSAGETLREVAASSENRRGLGSVKQLVSYGLLICISKKLLCKDCLS